MKWYLKVLKQYAYFSGRARRTEYWMFVLFNLMFAFAAMAIDNLLGITFHFTNFDGSPMPSLYGYTYLLYALIMLVPGFAVSIRRLHDVGKSGWMFLVVFIPFVGAIWLLVLFCKDSQPGSNKWGPNPKEPLADFLDASPAP